MRSIQADKSTHKSVHNFPEHRPQIIMLRTTYSSPGWMNYGYRCFSILNGTTQSQVCDPFNEETNKNEKQNNTTSFQLQQRRGNRSWARRQALRKRFEENAKRMLKPTIATAASVPTSYSGMDNASLVVLGRMGIHGANKVRVRSIPSFHSTRLTAKF